METKAKRHFSRENKGSSTSPDARASSGFDEKVVHIGRCAKVVKGGRRFSFSALVVVGDRNGRVGVGYGRAHEVPEAVRKANEKAKNGLMTFELRGTTIPHEIIGIADGGKVFLKPAVDGTGLVAGGGVRAVLELVGAKNILSKSMRSSNPLATVHATIDALKKLRTAKTVRKLRGQQERTKEV
ncbi:MAG: 30S ribosomal protein S5 [Puniceicoccales bacterium]|jgi:small subunit ribosomal protein S5|nr:30S ribosomal protein S5 [Puniceicoccales bacterium]